MNRVFFTKSSDYTLQLLGKPFSYEFLRKQLFELLPSNSYKSLRIGLHDYMLNLTAFLHLNGLPMLSSNSSVTHVIIQPNVETFLPLLFSFILLLTHSSIYIINITPSQLRKCEKKTIFLLSASGYGVFGTVTETMIKPLNSNSDSDDSDTPPHSKSNIEPPLEHTKGEQNKPKITSKI